MRARVPVLLLALVLLAGAGCGRREAGRGDYLFLFLWEVNNRAVRAAPLELEGEAGARFDPRSRRLVVTRRAEVPGPGAVAVVLQQVDSVDLTLGSRTFAVERFPARVPVDAPVHRAGATAGADGVPRRLADLVDNGTRLLPGPLVLRAVAADGTAVLSLGGQEFRLRPGEGGAVAWARAGAGPVELVRDDARWEEEIGARLDRGDTLTVVRLHNHGWWPRSGVSVSAAGGD